MITSDINQCQIYENVVSLIYFLNFVAIGYSGKKVAALTTSSSPSTGDTGGSGFPFFGGDGNIDNDDEESLTPPIDIKRLLNGVDEKSRPKRTCKR